MNNSRVASTDTDIVKDKTYYEHTVQNVLSHAGPGNGWMRLLAQGCKAD